VDSRLHWYEQHIEHFNVVEDRVLVSPDSVAKLLTPGGFLQRREKSGIHEFMRADRDRAASDKSLEGL